MINHPEITVVIPTLNRPLRTVRAISSLNDQSYKGVINCVIIDSSSDRKTEDKINETNFTNPNLKIRYLKNNNSVKPIDNWILGAKEINTEYGKFLCDDDWLEKEYFDKCLNVLRNTDTDCVISNINIVRKNKSNILNYYKYSTNSVEKKDVVNSFLGINNILPVTPSASLSKTTVLLESFYESLKHIQCTENLFGFDFFMSYYPVFKSNGSYLLNEGLTNSYAGNDSMTLNVKKGKISYCYFFALINLIESSDFEVTRNQEKIIRHKLATFNLKKIIEKDYKPLELNNRFEPKLNLSKLFKSQAQKYYLKMYYSLKK